MSGEQIFLAVSALFIVLVLLKVFVFTKKPIQAGPHNNWKRDTKRALGSGAGGIHMAGSNDDYSGDAGGGD